MINISDYRDYFLKNAIISSPKPSVTVQSWFIGTKWGPYFSWKEQKMLKKIVLVFAILCMAAVVPPMAEAAKDQPRNIILFGWDGAQRDHVNECLSLIHI